MIFILVPPVFCIKRAELSYAHAQEKLPRLQDEHYLILTSVEVSQELLLYLLCESTKVLLVKKHIACLNRTNLCENYGP